VSGDTTPFPKPHPGPLLEGARRLGLAPEQCWYVGDDLRDVEAGRAAGMLTVACAWGYCGAVEPSTWGADYLIDTPTDLLETIRAVAGTPVRSEFAA
jgi:phosphoglycolate phosphatase